jgi:predicted metal-dependent HD superfamily phosphohydrolase
MASFGVEGQIAGEAFTDLAAYYEEDGRYYHTLTHVQNVLTAVDGLHSQARDFRAIKLAAWYHDVIYDPLAVDNEERSAQFAEQRLVGLGIPKVTIQTVCRLILATKTHQAEANDVDCQILLDADLATFGSDWAQQEEIAQAIRQEYAAVPDDIYRAGRRQVLEQFLARDRLYLTGPMFAAHEEKARQNLRLALAALADETAEVT